MQWIAMVTMLIDHIGHVWFPDEPIWRVIGRAAFPIYTYFIALGLERTRSVPRYLLRLAILAALSQLPFSLLFQTFTINVIGTFLVAAGVITLMERTPTQSLRLIWFFAGCVLLETISFDYGAYGLILLYLFRRLSSHQLVIAHTALNLLYVALTLSAVQLFSIFPTAAIAYAPALTASHRKRVPSWLWRSFYPAHLAVLYLASISLFLP